MTRRQYFSWLWTLSLLMDFVFLELGLIGYASALVLFLFAMMWQIPDEDVGRDQRD